MRHYRFLVEGLAEAASDLAARGVPLVVRMGDPPEVVSRLAREVMPAAMIGDENPLRTPRSWRTSLAKLLQVPFRVVDSDVVVPSSLFAREEYAARTIRPKIHRVWEQYLKAIPNPTARFPWKTDEVPPSELVNPDHLMRRLKVGGVGVVAGYKGGSKEAMRRLCCFVETRLPHYATERNEPTPYMTSELSAHLHFGHINPLTIALAVHESDAPRESRDAYLEELIVRRELAINFVLHNPRYDELAGCPDWRSPRWPITPTTRGRTSTIRTSSKPPPRTIRSGTPRGKK